MLNTAVFLVSLYLFACAPSGPAPPSITPAAVVSTVLSTIPAPVPAPELLSITLEERRLLEHLVMAEAGGEPYEAQLLVAQCVADRVEHEDFPSTIKEVVYQRDPVQFTPTVDGSLWRAPPSEQVKKAVSVVFDEGFRQSEASILYFMCEALVPERKKAAWFYRENKFVIEVGTTQFFTEKG